MKRRLAAVVLGSVLLAGCHIIGYMPTEKMQVKQMRVNGVDLAYVEEGRGETVVFVHGAFGDWRNWEGVRPAIAERYRFVSLSLRYHDPNAWPDNGENYSVAQHVEDVAQFIRQLNVGKVHLVGSSFGGRLVGYVALKYPELLRSVVMGEPSIIAPASVEGKAAGAETGKDTAKSVEAAKAGDDKQAAILLFNAVLNDPDAFRKAPLASQQHVLDNARTLSLLGPPNYPSNYVRAVGLAESACARCERREDAREFPLWQRKAARLFAEEYCNRGYPRGAAHVV